MKTIGLLGGMSWESTAEYYRLINEEVKRARGGLHSAKIALVSVDFAPVARLQHAGDWDGAARLLCQAARRVQAAGAELLLICTNTMHKVAPQIEAALDIPLLHIADATAAALKDAGVKTAGLLATAFTLQEGFYEERLRRHGIQVLTPPQDERNRLHKIIYEELCLGKILPDSKAACLRMADALAQKGAQGSILGCTEIGLLVKQADTSLPLFDTTALHAKEAVRRAVNA